MAVTVRRPPTAAVDERACAVARVRAARDAGQPITALLHAAADALEVTPRTFWRWLADGGPTTPGGRRSGWDPAAADVDAYVGCTGNAAAAWRERRSSEPNLPSLRTFQRGLRRTLLPGDRAAAREGVEGRRRHQVYLLWAPEARNLIWEADHSELDIEVRFPRSLRARRPWLTSFVDGYSRAVMGWAVSDTPTAGTVLAALGEAIRVDPTRGPFGGLPAVLRLDHGLEFAAQSLRRACGVLGVRLGPVLPYHPYLKAKIERLHGTIDDELLCGLPHFTGGRRDAAGRLGDAATPALGLTAFVRLLDAWFRSYNSGRPHHGLDGQTPLQRWCEDATPLRLCSDAELRWTLLGGAERTVISSGIRFHGLCYIAPELNGLVGETVEVRFRPHDDTSIEVFRAGAHLATARPQGALSAAEREAVLEQRRLDAAAQARRHRRAARHMRERLAPITADSGVADVTVISATTLTSERSGRADTALRRAARTDLLLSTAEGGR